MDLRKIKLVVFDSDGVLIPRGTKILESYDDGRFSVFVSSFRISNEFANKINEIKKKRAVCVNSGRSLIYLQSMYDKISGCSFIAENGHIYMIDGRIAQLYDFNQEYFHKIGEIRRRVRKLPITGIEPKQFMLTVHTDSELPKVREIVAEVAPEFKVMWNGEAFDIQRADISKGEALKRMMVIMGFDKDEVLAIGDRINDKDMIEAVGIGISTDKEHLKADYYLKVEELIDKLL